MEQFEEFFNKLVSTHVFRLTSCKNHCYRFKTEGKKQCKGKS